MCHSFGVKQSSGQDILEAAALNQQRADAGSGIWVQLHKSQRDAVQTQGLGPPQRAFRTAPGLH